MENLKIRIVPAIEEFFQRLEKQKGADVLGFLISIESRCQRLGISTAGKSLHEISIELAVREKRERTKT